MSGYGELHTVDSVAATTKRLENQSNHGRSNAMTGRDAATG
jgi:hypothetical protein